MAGIYINAALLVFGLLFFYQNLVRQRELKQMYEDIYKFRKELIKLAASRPRRRF